jgi:hypothetical protein
MLCLHVHVVFIFFIYIIFNHASSVFLQVMFYVFIIFLVYSPASKRNLAVRNQISLKLGYALTMHKSQGMTLER